MRTRRLAGSMASMARTHPLTGVSTVALTLVFARCCCLLAPWPVVTERYPLSASCARTCTHAHTYSRAKASL